MSHRRLGAPGGRRPASRSVGAASERQHRVTVELRLGTSLTIKMCRPDPDHCPRRDEGEEQTVKTQDDMKLSTHRVTRANAESWASSMPGAEGPPWSRCAGRREGRGPDAGRGARARRAPPAVSLGTGLPPSGGGLPVFAFRPEFPPRSTVSSSKRFGETQRGGTCGAPI